MSVKKVKLGWESGKLKWANESSKGTPGHVARCLIRRVQFKGAAGVDDCSGGTSLSFLNPLSPVARCFLTFSRPVSGSREGTTGFLACLVRSCLLACSSSYS